MSLSLLHPTIPTKTLRILIVDDNQDAADSLGILCNIWGHDVQTAYSAHDALKLLADFTPDCIVTDIGMPILDGYGFARAVRRDPRLARANIIALTAFSDDGHMARIRESDFDHYLVKPADPDELARRLDAVPIRSPFERASGRRACTA